MYLGNKIAKGSKQISELFAEFFNSVYKPPFDPPLACNISYNPDPLLTSLDFSLDDLAKALANLKNKNSMGPDGIPESFIRLCQTSLLLPIFILFKCFLNLGYIPEILKEAFIIPVFKSGCRSDVSNYRPITIINILAKIFDYLIYTILYEKLSELISKNQHGFMKNRSVVTSLLEFSGNVINSINNNSQTDVVYLDFAKAFDSLDHGLLSNKLFNLGIRGWALKTVTSFLSMRRTMVLYNNSKSTSFIPSSGIAQGSHTGPLLFIIFINDLFNHIESSNLELFADDSRLGKEIMNVNDAKLLQKDISNFHTWSVSNGMPLNLKKCSVITFSRKQQPLLYDYRINSRLLERTSEIKDLGITLDEKWTFSSHRINTTSKALKMLGFLKRSTLEFKAVKTLTILFKSLVLPHLTYASVI